MRDSLKRPLLSLLLLLVTACGQDNSVGDVSTNDAGLRTIYVRAAGMVKKLGVT